MEGEALIDESGCNDSSYEVMTELDDGKSQGSAEDSSSSTMASLPVHEMSSSDSTTSPRESEDAEKKDWSKENFEVEQVSAGLPIQELELELMKERFAKLLLGEDMSGSGNGVSAASTISNAITNLCATLFGQLWRLEPLAPEKKSMWRREMECLLCVSDHIFELRPTWQTFPDGSKLEVMTTRPRSDICVNLPALRKLDNMLLEILDCFVNQEFWYVDQGVLATDADGSSSFRQALQRLEEKWWLPVAQVPPCGLDESSRKQLQHKRDSTKQILKAAMAINNITLADMETPDTYLESLPKTARASLGDVIYRYITTDNFSPECLLACLDLSSEHQAIEIANRVEAAIYIWRKKTTNSRPTNGRQTTRSGSRSSWEIIKDLIVEGDKIETLAERAECLLLSLKQRFPALPQTALDMSKIQCNRDVGKSILESYSRVLESLASNIVARIDDVLYVDDLTKHSDVPISPLSKKVGVISHKSISVPSSFGTPSFSPAARCASPAKEAKSPSINNNRSSNNLPQRGVVGSANKVLTHFGTSFHERKERFVPTLKTFDEVPPLRTFDDDDDDEVQEYETDLEFSDDCTEEDVVKLNVLDRAWLE